MPAISNKVADIPPDEYSWRKYGQKPIKGSPHPRYITSTFGLCSSLQVPIGTSLGLRNLTSPKLTVYYHNQTLDRIRNSLVFSIAD